MNTCKYCTHKIEDDHHVYIRKEYYHDKCYIAYVMDVATLIYNDAKDIIEQTQDTNAAANSRARRIIRRLEEI